MCHCILIDINPGAYMYHKLLLAILIHVLFLTPLNTAGGPKCVASTKYHQSEYELSNQGQITTNRSQTVDEVK